MNRLKTLKPFAKFLSYVLGRNPFEFGLIPDENGYVKIKELIKAIVEEDGWKHIKMSHIDELLYSFPEPPVEVSDSLIRAVDRSNYTKPVFAEKIPKEIFTAIRSKAHFHVVKKGIDAGDADYVILSSDESVAEKIGKRKDRKPVILKVNTVLAEDEGVFFFTAGESIYLASYIPAGCFSGPPLPDPKDLPAVRKKVKTSSGKNRPAPGSYFPDVENSMKGAENQTGKKIKKRDKTSWKANKKKIRREKPTFDS